jgi:S1-C subfamily serine protease
MTNERAKDLGLESVEGVYITRVSPGSGADDAGLRAGDVIVGINGVKTKTLPEMQEQVGRYRPGNGISIDYIRKGKRKKTKVILKNKSNSTEIITASTSSLLEELGFDVRELTRDEEKRLEVKGVKVIRIYRGSRIERTNMDPGFIITKMDNNEITNLEDLTRLLEKAEGKVMFEGVYENYPGEYYYAFPMEK